MSGSRWVITPWLPGSLIIHLYSSSAYSHHVFLISSASVRSILFLSFFPYLCMKCFLHISKFLKRSLVFLFLLFSPIYLHWSFRNVFYLPLLFFATLHSNGFIFPFLLWLSLLFFNKLEIEDHEIMRLSLRYITARSLGQEDPLEKEMATLSNIPAWKIL